MSAFNPLFQGNGPGPPMVFINGIGDLRSIWHYQRRAFSGRCRTVSYDHPGTGRSPPREGDRSIWDYARALLELIDTSLGPTTQAVLVGHSFGGRVAQAAALLAPSRVLGLVLVSTSCDRHPPLEALRARKTRSAAEWVDEIFSLLYGSRFIQEQGERLFVLARGRAGVEELAPAAMWEAWDTWDESSRVPEISAPCLVIHGEADRVITPEHARRLASLIPSAELALLPAVGHCPHVEDPSAFNQLVSDFLDRRLKP